MTENKYTEKDELRQLFAEFNPRMPGETDFVARLERRLSAIEDVRERSRLHFRRMKRAIVAAALFGVFVGVALTLSFPWILAGIAALLSGISPSITACAQTVSWVIVSSATLLSAAAAYDLSLSPALQQLKMK